MTCLLPTRDNHIEDVSFYRTLLESTKAIPWRIDLQTMQFTYIGPQVEQLLGWSQASWGSVTDWVERIHPEDRQKTIDFCISQVQQGIDHEADYRAKTANGEYVWIREVAHVLKNADGTVDSLVGFMFDISERKKVEDRVLKLQKELETLSYKDSLTGVANRRYLDALLEVEWAKARVSRHPLSLIMVDIDFFKQYNDHYGHCAGDKCLKRVAQVLSAGAARARDLCARIGGEEFMLVLPETDEAAAFQVAERCRKLLISEGIPHALSNVSSSVTCSMGIASIVPRANDELTELIEFADRRLYQAKANGRDRIEAAVP